MKGEQILNSRRFFSVPALALLLSIAALPVARAHHSVTVDFDPDQTVSVTGILTNMEWTNPHVKFHIRQTAADGIVTEWVFEAIPPGKLRLNGIVQRDIPVGTQVIIEGIRARDGLFNGSGYRLFLSDGREIDIRDTWGQQVTRFNPE